MVVNGRTVFQNSSVHIWHCPSCKCWQQWEDERWVCSTLRDGMTEPTPAIRWRTSPGGLVVLVRRHWIRGAARWSARSFGTLAAGVFMLFLLEGFGSRGVHTLNPSVLSMSDLIVISLRLLACVGLLLAWRWEALGGGIALVCMVIATILRPWVPVMVVTLTAPGGLYLLSWFLRRQGRPSTAH